MTAKDPYRYFRVEAHDLIGSLGTGVLQLERAGSVELVERLMRMAHTLKGAARVVRQTRISEVAHAFEDLLHPYRGSERPLDPAHATPLLALVDEASSLLAAIDGPKPAAQAEARTERPDAHETSNAPRGEAQPAHGFLRVEEAGLESTFLGLVEAATSSGRLARRLEALSGLAREARELESELARRKIADTRASSLADLLEDLAQEVTADADALSRRLFDLERATHELVLVPVQQVFPVLERAVRDAATTLGREVEFAADGGEVRLEAELLNPLREALLHLVRNAVAHGIEAESERRSLNKPVVGRVQVLVTRRERRVRFEVIDDGRGLDVASIARAAIDNGRISPEDGRALDANQAAKLLLERGFSTHKKVDVLAGRGIGLDVARGVARALGGSLALASRSGLGLTATLEVPVSRSAFECLVVRAGGMQLAIPLDAIEGAVMPELVSSSGRLGAIVGEEPLPFEHLATLVGASREHNRLGVVLAVGTRRAVLGVDRLLGQRELRSSPLPGWLSHDPLVSAAWVDEEGLVRLILDPESLVERCLDARVPELETRERPAVLVVDDSLTTRMLEKSILEAAGYEVDLAVSGEDGLQRARSRPYGAFVVDVEMPGMDGYAFTRAVCEDPSLGHIPVILVTSRGDPEDRRRGAEAGARAHIAKGEFDQEHLLATMSRLMEAP